MNPMLARNWWMLVLRGVLATIFGVLALVWPGLTLLTLVILFGAYALVDGLISVIVAFARRGLDDRWWATLLRGVAGIIIGIVTFVLPGVTALVLLYFIAGWAFITGLLEIVAAIRLRHAITAEWVMILGGILSIIFGVLIVLFPGEGALSLTWLIGIYAIAFGILLIVLGSLLRNAPREAGTGHASHA